MKRYLAYDKTLHDDAHARTYGLNPIRVRKVFMEPHMQHRMQINLTPSGEAALRIISFWQIRKVNGRPDLAQTAQANELPSLMCNCLNVEPIETIRDGCTEAFAQIRACELQKELCHQLEQSTVNVVGWDCNSKVDVPLKLHEERYINWCAASCPLCGMRVGVVLLHGYPDYCHEMRIVRYYGLGSVQTHSVPWRVRI